MRTMTHFTDLYWTSPDGLRLHARDYRPAHDAGRLPVICLPGLTRNARDFEDVAPAIAAGGRRVLAASLRGRGQSQRSAEPMTYAPPVYANDILAMMDDQGIERALFVGTSLGGLVTMVLASLAPQRVAGAVLNDIGPKMSPVGLARIASYAGGTVEVASWDEAARRAQAINGVAFPDHGPADWDAFARRLFVEDGDRIRPDYDPEIAAPFRAAAASPGAGAGAALLDLTPLFVNLATGRPLLLVHGEISDLIDEALAAEMRAAAPDMAYVEVPRVGHAPMLTEPPARAAIEAWLAAAP
jgi:pimeloyl-ACP methyl ester carboxylesterase